MGTSILWLVGLSVLVRFEQYKVCLCSSLQFLIADRGAIWTFILKYNRVKYYKKFCSFSECGAWFSIKSYYRKRLGSHFKIVKLNKY